MALSENDPRVKALKARLANYRVGDTLLRKTPIQPEVKLIAAPKVPQDFVALIDDPMAAVRDQQLTNTSQAIWRILDREVVDAFEKPRTTTQKTFSVNGHEISKADADFLKSYNKVLRKFNGNLQAMGRAGYGAMIRKADKILKGAISKEVNKQVGKMGYGKETSDAYMNNVYANNILAQKLGAADYNTPVLGAQKAFKAQQTSNANKALVARRASENAVAGGYDNRVANSRDFDKLMFGVTTAPVLTATGVGGAAAMAPAAEAFGAGLADIIGTGIAGTLSGMGIYGKSPQHNVVPNAYYSDNE